MPTNPLRDPINVAARIYQGDLLLAAVKCRLAPDEAPTYGMALVPDNRDWFQAREFLLVVDHTGRRYLIKPTRLNRAPGAPPLLLFQVRPAPVAR